MSNGAPASSATEGEDYLWYHWDSPNRELQRLAGGGFVSRRGGRASSPAPAEPTAEPKTDRGRRTRDLIVRAARTVFEEKGFLDARIADIAAAAEMSHGTFYTYFQTKDEVFLEIMAQVAEGQYEATRVPVDLAASPAMRIEYSIRQYLRSYQATARLSGVIEQVAILNDGFRVARLELRAEFRDRIERGIRRMQDHGLVETSLSARVAAEAITSMLSNFAYITLTLGEHYDEDEAVATLTRMWTGGIGLRSDT